MSEGRARWITLALTVTLAACGGGDAESGAAPGAPGGQDAAVSSSAGAGQAAGAGRVLPGQAVIGQNAPGSFPVGRMPGLIPSPEEVPNPYAGDAGALREGRQLFVAYNCYGCHGGHGGGGMGPSLRDDTWIYGGSAIEIFDSIAEGRPNSMPAWQAMLPAEIIWKMTAYIQSMRTEDEPEPPPRNRALETAGGEESGSGSEGAPAEPV